MQTKYPYIEYLLPTKNQLEKCTSPAEQFALTNFNIICKNHIIQLLAKLGFLSIPKKKLPLDVTRNPKKANQYIQFIPQDPYHTQFFELQNTYLDDTQIQPVLNYIYDCINNSTITQHDLNKLNPSATSYNKKFREIQKNSTKRQQVRISNFFISAHILYENLLRIYKLNSINAKKLYIAQTESLILCIEQTHRFFTVCIQTINSSEGKKAQYKNSPKIMKRIKQIMRDNNLKPDYQSESENRKKIKQLYEAKFQEPLNISAPTLTKYIQDCVATTFQKTD